MASKKNKRCPLQNECGRTCAHVGAELECDYYKNNGIGDMIIEDQEKIRHELETAKMREIEETMIEDIENTGELVMLPVDSLYPHPDNPRKKLGDLKELAESIKAKGIMQNLTVVPKKDDYGKYTIIIGHRRHAAAKLAKVTEVPCVIVNMSEQDQLGTMLLENMQRSDLTAYEQAKGFQLMMDFGDSVAGIVKKTGFSETTVRRRLEMAKLDDTLLEKASAKQISFGDIDKLSQIDSIEERNKVLKDIGTSSFGYSLQRAIDGQENAKMKPVIRQELIDAGYLPIENSQGCDYITTVNKSYRIEEAKKHNKALTSGEQIYFVESASSYANFFIYKKSDATKNTPANESKPAYVDKHLERRTQLAQAFKTAFECRYKFVTEISENSLRDKASVVVSFALARELCDLDGNKYYDSSKIKQALKVRENDELGYFEILEDIEKEPLRSLLIWTYLSFGDSETMNCYDYNCEYEDSMDLEGLYNILTDLGYDVSDDEKALLDGSSELYVRTENE